MRVSEDRYFHQPCWQVKILCGDDLRRFELYENVSFKTFQQIATQYCQLNPSSSYKFQYQDDEGDWVTFSSDEELHFAFQLFNLEKKIRMKVLADNFSPNSSNHSTFSNQHYLEASGKMAARFIKHVTVDDNTKFYPHTSFTKTWRFRNESSIPWPEGCRMLFVSKEGDSMSGPDSCPVPVCQPGKEVDVSVPLKAPERAGIYTGYWRLANPSGKKFGQRVRVLIQVVEPSPPHVINSLFSSSSYSSSPLLFPPSSTYNPSSSSQNSFGGNMPQNSGNTPSNGPPPSYPGFF